MQAQDQEEWKPLALMVAEFEASTPARFNHGPRAVQYVPPPQPGPDARVEVSHRISSLVTLMTGLLSDFGGHK